MHSTRRRARWGWVVGAVLGALAGIAGPPSTTIAAEPTSAFRPLESCRLLDSRDGGGAALPAGGSTTLPVAGRCGVPAGATAVTITVTAVRTSGSGFVTVYPAGQARPLASTLNYRAGETRANGAIVQLGAGGSIDLYTLMSSHLVVDVTGVWTAATRATAGRLVPIAPTRQLDTRAGPRPGPGSVVRVPLPAGVPPTATAVAVNLTVDNPAAPGFATAFPAGGTRPLASNLNWERPGQVRAATSIVPVSAAGIDVYVLAAAHVIADVTAWFTGPEGADSADGLFVPQAPTRVLDTRQPRGPSGGPQLWASGARELALGGMGAAVAANLTVVSPDGPGWWLAYPAGTPTGEVSSINTDAQRQVVANLGVLPLSERGLGILARTAAHFVVDITGWFTGAPVEALRPVPANVNTQRTVTIISDSGTAGIRWNGALAGFQGFAADARLESCRRLVLASCRGREGYAPPTVVGELSTMPAPRPSDILFIATGYNDWSGRFSSDFDIVVATARSVGFEHIAWMSYRGSTNETNNWEFQQMNAIVDAKLASGAYPDVELWDLAGYTATSAGWFTADGVHLQTLGAWGVADWVSRHVAYADDRACPQAWSVGGTPANPCPWPDPLPAQLGMPDIRGLYLS